MGGTCSIHGEIRNVYTIFVRKCEERAFGRPRLRCEDNIRFDRGEISWGYLE